MKLTRILSDGRVISLAFTPEAELELPIPKPGVSLPDEISAAIQSMTEEFAQLGYPVFHHSPAPPVVKSKRVICGEWKEAPSKTDRNLVLAALDHLGAALKGYSHTWTPTQRALYDKAVEILS